MKNLNAPANNITDLSVMSLYVADFSSFEFLALEMYLIQKVKQNICWNIVFQLASFHSLFMKIKFPCLTYKEFIHYASLYDLQNDFSIPWENSNTQPHSTTVRGFKFFHPHACHRKINLVIKTYLDQIIFISIFFKISYTCQTTLKPAWTNKFCGNAVPAKFISIHIIRWIENC